MEVEVTQQGWDEGEASEATEAPDFRRRSLQGCASFLTLLLVLWLIDCGLGSGPTIATCQP